MCGRAPACSTKRSLNGSLSSSEEPIGTRLISSTPPATTMSAWPETIIAAAVWTACCEDPHWRSTVCPGTVFGQPAAMTELRATL